MKTLLTLLFSFLLSVSSEATITRVQSGSQSTNSGTGITFTITAPDLTDNLYHYLLIGLSTTAAGWTEPAISGCNWMHIVNNTSNSTNQCLMFGRVIAASYTSVNPGVTGGSNVPIVGIIVEYKSNFPLVPDQVQQSSAGGTTTASTGTTSATNFANELCFAVLTHRLQSSSTTGTFASPTNSYAEISAGGKSTNVNTANSDREVDVLEKFLTSTGTTSTAATVTGSNNVCGMVFTFAEAPLRTSFVAAFIRNWMKPLWVK